MTVFICYFGLIRDLDYAGAIGIVHDDINDGRDVYVAALGILDTDDGCGERGVHR